jgi:rubrerythrin
MTTTLKASLIRKAIRDYNYQYDAITGLKELLWRCAKCGELIHRKDGLPEKCPSCGASRREFSLVEED